MSKHPQSQPDVPPIDPDHVYAYLATHPEFLSDHPELLIGATVPARFDPGRSDVVDFRDALVGRLRKELADLHDVAEELIANSRINHEVQQGTLRTTLGLLECDGLGPLTRMITEDMPVDLDVDVAVLRMETPLTEHQTMLEPAEGVGLGLFELSTGRVDDLLSPGQAVRLRPELSAGEGDLYGDAGGTIRSDALIRIELGEGRPDGVLALGCREPHSFTPDMAVDMLSFVARIVEHCIRRWMPTPAP